MLILAIIVFGMTVGAVAQLATGRTPRQVDWKMAFIAGLAGSLIGGLLSSLVAGDGLALRPSGLIGSFVGAVVITVAWQCIDKKRRADARTAAARKPWDKS